MVDGAAVTMLSHFLDHYERAGVILRTHAAFLVHVPNNTSAGSSGALRLLTSRGVRLLELTRTYHSNLKRDRINAHIRSLPTDAWLIYADVDELFHFPCRLTSDCISAQLVDRLALGRRIPTMGAHPHDQFPVCAKVREQLTGLTTKFVLFRVRSRGATPFLMVRLRLATPSLCAPPTLQL